MDTHEKISAAFEIIEKEYKEKLIIQRNKDARFLEISYPVLVKHEPDLASELLSQPEETIKVFEIAISQIDDSYKDFKARFIDMPKGQITQIRNLRSRHLNIFTVVRGQISQQGEIRPMAVSARFECPSCGNILNVLQVEEKFKEPSRCGCGRKGKFSLLIKEMVDYQRMALEEMPEDIDGGLQPQRLNCLLKHDLVSPLNQQRNNVGSNIVIAGVLKEVPTKMRDGGQSRAFDWIFEVNSIQPLEEDTMNIEITAEDEQKIKELAQKEDLFNILIDSIVPTIQGNNEIKEAALLYLAGGVRKINPDGSVSRGDSHILLVGDPSAGKSAIVKKVTDMAPKGRYIAGKGVSGVGVTAAVVRDEFMGGFALKAGAMVLAHKGACGIDELDKISKDDRDYLHEALEQQTVTITKAGINATLNCQTPVIAAANPKLSRFDPHDSITSQIDLPPTLISRFDLIFIVRDVPNEERDEKIASFILNKHMNPSKVAGELSRDLLKKYILYSKKNFTPSLTEKATKRMHDYYKKMRNGVETAYVGGRLISEQGERPVSLTTRQLEGLIRLSEASAKLRHSSRVEEEDAERAIRLLSHCLIQLGYDKETGSIDIDRVGGGVSFSTKSVMRMVKNYLYEHDCENGRSEEIEVLFEEMKKKHENLDKEMFEEALSKLKTAGDVFNPKRTLISLI